MGQPGSGLAAFAMMIHLEALPKQTPKLKVKLCQMNFQNQKASIIALFSEGDLARIGKQ
jgi:hypothetical protein